MTHLESALSVVGRAGDTALGTAVSPGIRGQRANTC